MKGKKEDGGKEDTSGKKEEVGYAPGSRGRGDQ